MNRKPHCEKQRLFPSMRLLPPAVNLSELQRRLSVLNWESRAPQGLSAVRYRKGLGAAHESV